LVAFARPWGIILEAVDGFDDPFVALVASFTLVMVDVVRCVTENAPNKKIIIPSEAT
jgi:hypothetical protein